MSSIGPKRYDAFLSYNSQDALAVQEVAKRLKDEGLGLYLEEWQLAPGREFQPALAQGLNESKTCVVFLGPNDLGPWQEQELQVAIDKGVRDKEFNVIPVLLPGAERPRRGDVAHLDFLINRSWVEFLKTVDDKRAIERLVWGIKGKKPPELDARRYEGVCPYRGLEAFRPEDEQFFFGRENLTGWLISALRGEVRATQGVRFLGVLGPSGSGKSSVVLAGLVPKLKAGAIEGSDRWPVAILRPGDNPLERMTEKIVPKVREVRPDPSLSELGEQDDLLSRLRTKGEDAANALNRYVGLKLSNEPDNRRLVIIVDQFEEVFTHRPQDDQTRARFEQDRAAFFANLLQAAATPGGRVAVVLTMRSDFLSACAAFPQLAAVLSAHQELVGPMTAAELREAIEQPAFCVGCEVQPALTKQLLADMGGQRGALPHLQFALTEVWRKRDVRRLTLRAYEELGKDDKGNQRGIEGVLDRRANEIYRHLKPEDQELCRRLFLRLVQPGEGTEDTKRRVPYRELLPDDPARAEAVKKLVHILADPDKRLVTTTGTDATDGAVEVAHEALIRGWMQLRAWLDEAREDLRTHRRLTASAQEWADAAPKHKGDYLYAGARLAACREWAKAHRDQLNPDEVAFLDDSEKVEREKLEGERRQLEEVEHERVKREADANGWVNALESADVSEVPGIIGRLGPDRQLVLPRLREMTEADETKPGGARRRLHAALALLPADPMQVGYIVDRLLQENPPPGPDELIVIRKALLDNGHTEALRPRLWALLEKTIEWTDIQLRAAGTLALIAPEDPRWPGLGPSVTAKLVRENPLLIGSWREVFRPVNEALAEPLRAIYGDRTHPAQRELAASLLFDFAIHPNNPHPTEDLIELIGEADPPLFQGILGKITNPVRAIVLLAPKLNRLARLDDVLARRQGHLATALARLGVSERVWPLLRHSDDPNLRTELIHDLAKFGVDPGVMIERLKVEPDVSARRALLLALGEYPTDQVPADDRRTLIPTLLAWYRDDPDPGVHSGVDWLLRQKWDQGQGLERIDRELAGRGLAKDRDWYVNGQGQTFAVLRGPVEFLMGSPTSEVGRDPEEMLHPVQIPRSFAVATRAVTIAQYQHFRAENPDVEDFLEDDRIRTYIPNHDCPIIAVTWYDAAKYCNWLSGQEGIPESQWCYPTPIMPGMKLESGYLSRSGYRLPTEAEWECACRAGSAASRFYGASEEMLDRFGWYEVNAGDKAHPAGQLKPNDSGLFDMLGNAFEWTQDRYDPYEKQLRGRSDRPVIDAEKPAEFLDDKPRVLRGGALLAQARRLRSAARNGNPPTDRFEFIIGFRPARTHT
jgi:formylglycine-generating enzyme required for sulfatase activity